MAKKTGSQSTTARALKGAAKEALAQARRFEAQAEALHKRAAARLLAAEKIEAAIKAASRKAR